MRSRHVAAAAAIFSLALSAHALRAADYSDPKKTIESLEKAIADEKPKDVAAAFTTTDERQPLLNAIAENVVASHHLKQAAVAKFGDDGKSITTGRGVMFDPEDRIQRIKDAEVKIDGDTATLTPKPDPEGATESEKNPKPLNFKKINGDWKIDLDKTWDASRPKNAGAGAGPGAGGAGPGGGGGPGGPGGGGGGGGGMFTDPSRSKMFVTISKTRIDIMNKVADDIKADKYKTVDDAKQALQSRMRDAMRAQFGNMRPGGGGAPTPPPQN